MSQDTEEVRFNDLILTINKSMLDQLKDRTNISSTEEVLLTAKLVIERVVAEIRNGRLMASIDHVTLRYKELFMDFMEGIRAGSILSYKQELSIGMTILNWMADECRSGRIIGFVTPEPADTYADFELPFMRSIRGIPAAKLA